MRVVKALDAGPMLATARAADRAGRDERRGRARPRASSARGCWSTTVDALAAAAPSRRRRTRRVDLRGQAHQGRGRGRLDASRRARIHNLVRGLHPWPLVAARLGGIVACSFTGPRLTDDGADADRPARSSRRTAIDLEIVAGDGVRHPRSSRSSPKGDASMSGARVPRRPPRPAGRDDRAGMIAPARVAAYDVLRAVGSGPSGSAAGARASRVPACTTNATARWPARSPPARCAGRAALDHLIASCAGRPLAQLDPRGPRHPPPRRSSSCSTSTASRASAVVNDAVSLTKRAGKRSAARSRERGARASSCASADTLPLPPRPADPRDQRGGARLPGGHAVASALAGGALAAPVRLRGGRGVGCGSTTPPAPLTLRVNRLRDDPRGADRGAGRGRTSASSLAASRPDALIVARGQSAADAARRRRLVLRPGRSVAARRRCSSAPGRANGCSTPARRRAARRRRWRPPWRTTAWSPPPTCAAAASSCWPEPSRSRGRARCRVLQADAARPLPFSPGLRCRPRRRALLGPRHHPARPRHQVAADRGRTSPRSPPPSGGCCDQAAGVSAPGRTARLCDLLERARGERRGRRRRSWTARPDFRRGPAGAELSEAVADAGRSSAAACALCRTATASKRFSRRPWSKAAGPQ